MALAGQQHRRRRTCATGTNDNRVILRLVYGHSILPRTFSPWTFQDHGGWSSWTPPRALISALIRACIHLGLARPRPGDRAVLLCLRGAAPALPGRWTR